MVSVKIKITATGLRGSGKTYILNRLEDEVKRIEEQLPGRIKLVLKEKHGEVK